MRVPATSGGKRPPPLWERWPPFITVVVVLSFVGIIVLGSSVSPFVRSRHHESSNALLVPPMLPPEPVERGTPGILTSIDDTVRACSDWRISDADLAPGQLASAAEAARVLAVCSFLTGQRTTVKAGSAAVSLDLPSVAIGFALALFLWGVLVRLGSMFRSAFRRTPQPTPQRWASVEPFDPEWRRGG